MAKCLPKHKEPFNLDHLHALRLRFHRCEEGGSDRFFCSYASSLATVFKVACGQGFNPSNSRSLDLGSGGGYVLAAFSLVGSEAYGIEKSKRAIQMGLGILEGLRLPHQPQVIHGNYHHRETLEQQFPDGGTIQEMDLVYCFSYSARHAVKTFTRTIAPSYGPREGTLIAMTGFHPGFNAPFFSRMGLEILSLHSNQPYSLFRKKRSVDYEEGIEKRFDYTESF